MKNGADVNINDVDGDIPLHITDDADTDNNKVIIK